MDSPHLINSVFLHKLILGGPKKVIEWCMEVGLLAKEMKCPKCKENMVLVSGSYKADNCEWRCRKRNGSNKHDCVRSVRVQSFFYNSRLKVSDMLLLIYFWIHKCSYEFISHEIRITSSTHTDFMKYAREICLEALLRSQTRIGGENSVVDIVECEFGERSIEGGIEGDWLIAGVTMGDSGVFLAAVPDISITQVMQVMEDCVLPGTTTVCSFLTKSSTADKEFRTFLSKHSLKLENPESEFNSLITDANWKSMKKKIKTSKMYGNFLNLAEFLWRRKSVTCDFELFLSDVKKIYPPLTEEYNMECDPFSTNLDSSFQASDDDSPIKQEGECDVKSEPLDQLMETDKHSESNTTVCLDIHIHSNETAGDTNNKVMYSSRQLSGPNSSVSIDPAEVHKEKITCKPNERLNILNHIKESNILYPALKKEHSP